MKLPIKACLTAVATTALLSLPAQAQTPGEFAIDGQFEQVTFDSSLRRYTAFFSDDSTAWLSWAPAMVGWTDPDGTIVASKLTQSSGNKAWDEAVQRAVERTATLPRDENGRVPSTIVLGFRPLD